MSLVKISHCNSRHLRLLLPCFGMCLSHGNCLCGDKGCSFLLWMFGWCSGLSRTRMGFRIQPIFGGHSERVGSPFRWWRWRLVWWFCGAGKPSGAGVCPPYFSFIGPWCGFQISWGRFDYTGLSSTAGSCCGYYDFNHISTSRMPQSIWRSWDAWNWSRLPISKIGLDMHSKSTSLPIGRKVENYKSFWGDK